MRDLAKEIADKEAAKVQSDAIQTKLTDAQASVLRALEGTQQTCKEQVQQYEETAESYTQCADSLRTSAASLAVQHKESRSLNVTLVACNQQVTGLQEKDIACNKQVAAIEGKVKKCNQQVSALQITERELLAQVKKSKNWF